jgi:hypothetical protein
VVVSARHADRPNHLDHFALTGERQL